MPEEMYDRGYRHIFNIDISPVVIEQMAKRNAIKRPELKCKPLLKLSQGKSWTSAA